jgi:uncharacterized DUF497 family protein
MGKNLFVDCLGFDWDEWNSGKIWERHRVTPEEAEDVFFRDPFVVKADAGHSATETRYGVLGQTAKGRRLFVAFALRRKFVRVISARDMNQKEDREYQRHEESDS